MSGKLFWKNNTWGLRNKLVLLLVLFALIPAIVMGGISAYMSVNSVKEMTVQNNRTIARQVAEQIESMVGNSAAIVEGLAELPAAKLMDAAAMQEILLGMQRKNPQFELLYMQDAKGMQVAKTNKDQLFFRGDRQIGRAHV